MTGKIHGVEDDDIGIQSVEGLDEIIGLAGMGYIKSQGTEVKSQQLNEFVLCGYENELSLLSVLILRLCPPNLPDLTISKG